MEIEGGCYCGDVRYKVEGEPMFKGQCHCRECQYISGGSANVTMAMPEAGMTYTKGKPSAFSRSDLDTPVTREFCGNCGTHILAKSPALPGALLFKVGTFDDPAVFGMPQMAIFGCDKQPFQPLAEGIPTFEKGPGSATL